MIAIPRNRIGVFLLVLLVHGGWADSASAERVHLRGAWHLLRIDGPCKLKNLGPKITLFKIVNPETGRWELVWGDRFWDDTWIRDFLRLEGESDEVHKGETVTFLKPVTIALRLSGSGETEVEIDKRPAIHIIGNAGPKTNTPHDATLWLSIVKKDFPLIPKEPAPEKQPPLTPPNRPRTGSGSSSGTRSGQADP